VSAIAIETAPISTVVDETVLYAPTWTGYFDDTSHTSLGIGDKIIRALLERGVRVIYRTHPYTNRFPQTRAWHLALLDLLTEEEQRTGRGHLFGAAADTDLTLIECFNLCDAAVADVSGVSSDFLYSEKPLAMTDALGEGDDFVTNNPLAAATYVVSPDGGNLPAVLDALLGDDPLREERKRMKRYVLGDFAADAYEHAFLVAARREVIGAVAPAIPAQPSTTSRGLTTQR
jgi:CDP-glycerol glycerophosphotransferase (TagB/SpsB family)